MWSSISPNIIAIHIAFGSLLQWKNIPITTISTSDVEQAKQITGFAKLLRRSYDSGLRKRVGYFNPYLTWAESSAAFQIRSNRCQAKLRPSNKNNSHAAVVQVNSPLSAVPSAILGQGFHYEISCSRFDWDEHSYLTIPRVRTIIKEDKIWVMRPVP